MKRRRLPLLLGITAAAILTAVLWPAGREPEYHGKKLSEWLAKKVNSVEPQARAEAEDAIRNIGTNALPFLIQWIQYEPTPWRQGMNSIRTQLANRSRPKALVTHLFWDRRAYLAIYAVAGFGVLNSSAKAAAPELTRIATSSPSFDVSDRAIGALDAIGKESLPALIQIIADTNQKVMSRKLAISHLAWMNLGSNALPAIQPLIRCLKDDDHIVAMRAAAAIGRLKLQPDASVAALMDALQDSRPWLRVPCIQALGEFGEQALRAEPLLKQALDDPNLQMRSAVTNALLKIAPEVIYRLSPGLDSHWHPQ